VAQKSKPQTFVHIVAKYWPISKFFHRHILRQICNKVVTKYTTTPYVTLRRYTTLSNMNWTGRRRKVTARQQLGVKNPLPFLAYKAKTNSRIGPDACCNKNNKITITRTHGNIFLFLTSCREIIGTLNDEHLWLELDLFALVTGSLWRLLVHLTWNAYVITCTVSSYYKRSMQNEPF